MLKNIVKKGVEKGQVCLILGDISAPINKSVKPFIKSAKNILEWEETGEMRILNNKNKPTHVPIVKIHKKNCIDMAMITPGHLP